MNYQKTVNFIKSKIGAPPQIGMILGSGLSILSDKIKNPVKIPYSEIPGFKNSTAPGHGGALVFGTLFGKNVMCMTGRFHYYEGYSPSDIVYPIRVMKLLGARLLIITNAAGGINAGFDAGDIMVIRDHINLTGANPLIGPNDGGFGERFPDMMAAYAPKYRVLAKKAAENAGIPIKEGVYIGLTGPSFETPAEIKAFRIWGADSVGMSTVFEAIAAAHCSLDTLGLSFIANKAADLTDEKLSGDDVIKTGREHAAKLEKLIEEIFKLL